MTRRFRRSRAEPTAWKVVEVELAGADCLDADTALYFLDRIIGGAEQAGEAGEQWLDLRAEQAAGVKVRQEMLHSQQSVDFLGGEPQARQLVLRANRGLPFEKR